MSNFDIELNEAISEASDRVGYSWPLYSFVTSNPLAGFEEYTFQEAVSRARGIFGGRGYPPAVQFRRAYEDGRIDPDVLADELDGRGIDSEPEPLLDRLEEGERRRSSDADLSEADRSLNQILEKWLSSFLDEGQSRWSMPNREQGFYRAWYQLAPYDHHITDAADIESLPDNKFNAIRSVLEDVPKDDWIRVLTYHLTALPGWVGYIKQRNWRERNEWSEIYPIDLVDYAAVRLVLADQLGATVVPPQGALESENDELDAVREAFLRAWERTYQRDLLDRLRVGEDRERQEDRPDAQMVFCIDTRSEIIRRHIEATGQYETHGYGGFFGIPIQHRRYGEDSIRNACPPIVQSEHVISDVGRSDREEPLSLYQSVSDLKQATKKGLKNVKDNIGSSFSYVEFSGLFYGVELMGKTLFPGWLKRWGRRIWNRIPDYHEVTVPDLGTETDDRSPETRLNVDQQADYAEAAFATMGWTQFSPLVVFVGHSSETSNNPFDSSLRCGACAGQSGTPNARILAAICNNPPVREELRDRGIEVPEDTIFLAAKHNTTTDEITLYDDDVPEERGRELSELKDNLDVARERATAERVEQMPGGDPDRSVPETDRRSADWAETRPEWGLARNASIVVGPNRLRDETDLEGRAFLHSYDWREDPSGEALTEVLAGPVVVCQWINHQYYFASIDNGVWGSGSKITHNPVGNFGVLQGNGGDLMSGLPLQSLMRSDTEFQHQPLRLSVVVHSPLERVESSLTELDTLSQLIENDWISMVVVDPTSDDEIIRLESERGTELESV